MNRQNSDLGAAMLKRGREPSIPADNSLAQPLPVNEIAMVLTLDQLRPNPDNPRTSRNPRYDSIKASILARGLDSIPKVTCDPEGDGVYIFSDGGNTRYQILCELWQETGDEKFYRIHTIFKPWPGRLKCVIGHLAENDVRGDLSYIEKAFGIHKARVIWEEQLQRGVTLRELSDLLSKEGYPIDNSSISRMEDTLNYLYPHMPRLLEGGMSRGQITPLLSLRSSAMKVWKTFSDDVCPDLTLDDVFGTTCRIFDETDSYAFDIFRDEFIGELLKALPHPSLNYDRWLIEFDPKEQKRREQFGEPLPTPVLTPVPERQSGREEQAGKSRPANEQHARDAITPAPTPTLPVQEPATTSSLSPSDTQTTSSVVPFRQEVQPDLYGGAPHYSGETGTVPLPETDGEGALVSSLTDEGHSGASDTIDFAATGLEPIVDIWCITSFQDEPDHLKDMAFRLAFDLAESMGCAGDLLEVREGECVGYVINQPSSAFSALLSGLAGNTPDDNILSPAAVCAWLTGGDGESESQRLTDLAVVRLMRLVRVIRRLRELQSPESEE
ncbi:MAG TPA: ParB family protein [Scandinavium sp.]|jgi:ParB family protein of integrating conjugative element (PFGI_1 class)